MYLLLLIISILSPLSFANSLFTVEMDLYVDHREYGQDKAIKYQIVHSVGPSMNKVRAGLRSSLNYNYSVSDLTSVDRGSFIRTNYKLRVELLLENNTNPHNMNLIFPINPEIIFKKASRYRGKCAKSGYRGNARSFYWAWSPKVRGCKLKENIDYIKVKPVVIEKKNDLDNHLSSEFLVNGEYHLYYYYGSDYFSLRRFGLAGSAYASLQKKLKKRGFHSINTASFKSKALEKQNITSNLKIYSGELNGAKAFVYMMLGNSTEHTPRAKKEFFLFTKYALENGSSFTYSGHAGLGSVFNLDLQEKEYQMKINYNLNQKQLVFLDGCNTFFYSSNFFFRKKYLSNSLILVSNGLSISTKFYKQSVNTVFDILGVKSFTNKDLVFKINSFMKYQGASKDQYALVYALSN